MEALLNTPMTLWRLLPTWFRGLIRATRPKQWVKNGFVFIPILFDSQLTKPGPFFRVFVAAALFTIMSGSIYLLNDTVDVERDRLDPKKKNRPIANGDLPIPVAATAAVIFPILTIIIAFLLPPVSDGYSVPSGTGLALVLIAYYIKQIAYSFRLKRVVLLDVIILAAGYVMRVLAGALVITLKNPFSPWMYVCIGMLALFLAVTKRRQELIRLGASADNVRATYKEYNLALLDEMLRLVTTGSILSYTLYTVEAHTNLGGPAMLVSVPIAIYGVFRYLYLIYVKGEVGAAEEVLFKDKPLFATAVVFCLVVGIIIYVMPRITF